MADSQQAVDQPAALQADQAAQDQPRPEPQETIANESEKVKSQKLVLIVPFAPGDILVFTAALESLHKCYPGRYEVHVVSAAPAIFENNPHVASASYLGDEKKFTGAHVVNVHYPLIHESNQKPIHVMEAFVDYLRGVLKLPRMVLGDNRPRLYISDEEKQWLPQVHEKPFYGRPTKYWLLNAGWKDDMPAKLWPHYQEVVDYFLGKILFVQVGEENKTHHHPPLNGVLNMVGKTDTRQLIRAAYHAEGMLTGVSFLMHLAAAFEKPAVVLAGGREPRSWNTYPKQQYLSTIGQMECCSGGGCWRGKLVQDSSVPLAAKDNIGLCSRPVISEPPTASCMALTRPETVIRAIESYYEGGALRY